MVHGRRTNELRLAAVLFVGSAAFAGVCPCQETPRERAAPAVGQAEKPLTPSTMAQHLASCERDHVREFACVARPRDAETCPPRAPSPSGSRGYFTGHRAALPFDAELTGLHEESRRWKTGESPDCCYSRCRRVDVRAHGKVAHDYVSVDCLPAFTTSKPSAERPDCPAAIAWAGDWFEHVAPLLPEHTQPPHEVELAKELPDVLPSFPAVRWCCYRRAPMAAIGPL